MATRSITCDWLFTHDGPPLRNAQLEFRDDGIIVSIAERTTSSSNDHYKGIVCPGFVNAHCHLELSDLKDLIPQHTGLVAFLKTIFQLKREAKAKTLKTWDQKMFESGVSVVADICNSAASIPIKKASSIYYHNFIELLGMAYFEENAQDSVDYGMALSREFDEAGLAWSLAPHATYSTSPKHLQLISQSQKPGLASISSIHWMESPYEDAFVKNGNGPLQEIYKVAGYEGPFNSQSESLESLVLQNLQVDRLLLVHAVHSELELLKRLHNSSPEIYLCTCPSANLYIQNRLPNYQTWLQSNLPICIGTDSLSSNEDLDILEEIKKIKQAAPLLPDSELLTWASLNGAKFLGLEDQFGRIRPGMKPGLVHIALEGDEINPHSTSRRII